MHFRNHLLNYMQSTSTFLSKWVLLSFSFSERKTKLCFLGNRGVTSTFEKHYLQQPRSTMIETNILTPCSPSKDPLCSFILHCLNKTAYHLDFSIELGNACTRRGAEEMMTKRGTKRSVSSLCFSLKL